MTCTGQSFHILRVNDFGNQMGMDVVPRGPTWGSCGRDVEFGQKRDEEQREVNVKQEKKK